jgi:hypothetical protein
MESLVKIEYIVCGLLLVVATVIGLLTRGAVSDRGICLAAPLQFADGDVSGCITADQAQRLLDRNLVLGENRDTDGVTLTHPQAMDQQNRVANCRQYEKATAEGWYALSTYDMSMESFFRKDCALIDALAAGTPARRSFIKKPRVGINDLDIVSASVLEGFVPTGDAEATIGTLVRAGTITVDDRSARLVRLSSNGFTAQLEEMARGDFNGDGTEDILVFSAVHAQGGTIRGYNTLILSRMNEKEPITVAK